jgi:hypothetical protein
MIERIRRDLEQVRVKKFHKFEDLDPIIHRCISRYSHFFPYLQISKRGSKVVYHFHVPEVNAISIEKEHGSRDSIPKYYAKLIISGIDDLITYIEGAVDDAASRESSDD